MLYIPVGCLTEDPCAEPLEEAEMTSISTLTILFATLVVLGVFGNLAVMITVTSNAMKDRVLQASDLILANLSFINFLISILRNIFVIGFQIGFDVVFSNEWCRVSMFVWTLLKSMCLWSTFALSVYHYISIRNHHLKLKRNTLRNTVKALCGLWAFNCLYYIPSFLYTAHGDRNLTFTVQLVSSTTRPAMGCAWNFPNPDMSLVYVTASLVIHEIVPIILMVSTNISTIYILSRHSKAISAQKTMHRIASERRAALVITTLVILFVACWGTNVSAVNIYNFTKGSSLFLLILANFGSCTFMALSPLVLLGGHSKLRRRLMTLFCKQWKTQIIPAVNMPSKCNVTTVQF